ncbi:MAG: SPOR domain-containing protein, partial [Crocinitomicaceae bacterium]
VYRVQIGAFRKQIPQDLFNEFNPVTGEAIGTTGITRYMAGYFASSDKVAQAREQIRGLGYDDAFVVAYCDGKRIGYGDARRMEAAGTCVPQGESKLMMEVAENIAEEMGLPVKNEVEELPDYSYAQAPGAAPSSPIELTTGLFFTVQVGVFSKPVTKHDLLEMDELFTIRLPNGTIRYNSGMFNTVEDAKVRKKLANERGIKAFVTAYFEGERISIEEAQDLLAKRGEGILQTRIAPPEDGKTTEYEVPDHIVRTDTVQAGTRDIYDNETFERMQIVTKKSFDEFPRDILNRYNTKGTFYYDEKDGKVKSMIVENPVHLPRVYKFRHDVDTLYLDRMNIAADTIETDIIYFTTLTQTIPGDLMDWMMRFNYRREFELTEDRYTVRIFGIEPNRSQAVMEELRGFGYNPKIEELTEDELELNEQEE